MGLRIDEKELVFCTLDLVFEVDISFTKLLLNYHQGRTQSRAPGRRVRGAQPPETVMPINDLHCGLRRFALSFSLLRRLLFSCVVVFDVAL